MVVKTAGQYREVEDVFDFFAGWFVYCVRDAMKENARVGLWINQVGYIIVIAQLLEIYGNVNSPCSPAVYCHKSLRWWDNYMYNINHSRP